MQSKTGQDSNTKAQDNQRIHEERQQSHFLRNPQDFQASQHCVHQFHEQEQQKKLWKPLHLSACEISVSAHDVINIFLPYH